MYFHTSLRRPVLVVAAALLVLAGLPATGAAIDDRPTEIPYETPGVIPNLNADHIRNTQREAVVITDHALNPRRVTLEEGEIVAWISYSGQPSVVVFEREVARSMVCHSLVNFSLQDDELRSAPIHLGEFASFCQLKPGRYRYKVVRPDPGASAGAAAKRLDGVIVVGNPS